MSSGRMHGRGVIHMVSNRCEEKRFFLLPRKEVVRIVRYWLARAKVLYGDGLEIYGFIFMSNHLHILLRDTKGQLARFMGYFQAHSAKEINRLLGRTGSHFWQGPYNDLIIEGERTFWSKFLYVLANPVKSGLVMRSVEWLGVSSLKAALSGEPFSASGVDKTRYHNASRGKKKPDKEGFNDTYSFELTPLPMLAHLTQEERKETIKKILAAAEAHYRARWECRSPLGMRKVLAQSPFGRPRDPAKRPKRRFACDSRKRELELEEIYRKFIAGYKAVFDAFRKSALLRRPFYGEWPIGSYPPACWQPVYETGYE